MIQFLSDHSFNIDKVGAKLEELKKLKTKLSLRTFTKEDFQEHELQEASDVEDEEPLEAKSEMHQRE